MQGQCLPAEREMEFPVARMQTIIPTENFSYHIQGAIPKQYLSYNTISELIQSSLYSPKHRSLDLRYLILMATFPFLLGCATLTNDPTVPVTLSFSDGSEGTCQLDNKRWAETVSIPSTTMVRRSDDTLKYRCKTSDGRDVFGAIPSRMGGKIIASGVFLDFGITDAITDKHREYPASFVIPIKSE